MDIDLIGFGVAGLLLSLHGRPHARRPWRCPASRSRSSRSWPAPLMVGAGLDHTALMSAVEDLAGMVDQC